MEEKNVAKPVDAQIEVSVSGNKMSCSVIIAPPENGGAAPTCESIRAALAQMGVGYGIDDDAIERLAAPLYNTNVTVATGLLPENGEDGTVTELFPREKKPVYKEDRHGNVDYKNLGLITEVKAGMGIVDLTQPTPGTPGTDVFGREHAQKGGQMPRVPMGKGLALSPSGQRVEAACEGNLVYYDNAFHVETTYRVPQVDLDVGNITFSGDVVVDGDVLDGFEVKSGGNVTIHGNVGAANVSAAEKLMVEGGVNGGSGAAAFLEAIVVEAVYIENATVHAGQKLVAAAITNCTIECDGDIEVTKQKGQVCGGRITVYGSMNALEIGNDSNALTTIAMGVIPRYIDEKKKKNDQLAAMTSHIEELEKDWKFIERMVNMGQKLKPDHEAKYKRLKMQMPLCKKKKELLEAEIDALDEKMRPNENTVITAKKMYPPVRISFGRENATASDEMSNVRVYRNSEGTISFGMM